MPSRTKREPAAKRAPQRFPWFLLLALAGSAYVFWVLPMQLESSPVQVEFSEERTPNQ